MTDIEKVRELLCAAKIIAAPTYVITRYDHDRMRSVPIPGKRFTDMAAALRECTRINGFTKYSRQFLMVDLAAAFDTAPIVALSSPRNGANAMTRHYAPNILRSTTAEEDELALHLAQLDDEVIKLRDDIVAMVRARLDAQPAVKHVGGASLLLFRHAIEDGLSDLTYGARLWIDNRLEEISR